MDCLRQFYTRIHVLVMCASLAWLSQMPTAHAKVSFVHQVFPILERSCVKCHAPKEENGKIRKPKGGLRLDSAAGIMKGGKQGEVVVPGHPGKSLLYSLTILPKDHDDIMPSKGDTLKKKESDMILKWIQDGAQFGSWHGAEPTPKFGWPVSAAVFQTRYAKTLAENAKVMQPLSQGEKDALHAATFRVWPLAKNSPWLDVDMSGMDQIPTRDWQTLGEVGKRVVELDLSRSQAKDASLRYVAACTGLLRLNLAGTAITAEGLKALSALKQLRYLNLYGTQISDASALYGLTTLTHLYVGGTPLSRQASSMRELKSRLPHAQVIGTGDVPGLIKQGRAEAEGSGTNTSRRKK